MLQKRMTINLDVSFNYYSKTKAFHKIKKYSLLWTDITKGISKSCISFRRAVIPEGRKEGLKCNRAWGARNRVNMGESRQTLTV